ncbi:hypothetical protein L21SP5_01348 [Salinivirga cyanobacteriivorans]|uniref:Alpha/beta hydrolase family protein n=1 Tax=Salinivirga cyanobacteriivorans TaxID=1307839 RepID=A0A0S2HYE0_9BACT|nr:hypothetical protein [Salinivirga cyanobacteriivorans]ALO14998.1 hypothetical protein L21SP5_01348 [Salinivirga cyanobacteriivorans]
MWNFGYFKTIIAFAMLFCFLHSCQIKTDGELQYHKPQPEKGYNFPYLIFLPTNMPTDKELTMIVAPNNTGQVTDEFKKHIEKARRQATKPFYPGNYIASKLNLPLLVPIFPRSRKESRVYTHSLDRDVMLKKASPLKRIDLQLLAMHENALDTLRKRGFNLKEKFLMVGFSASGSFANRFSLIHPGKLLAVAAGGLNGILMLPEDTLRNQGLVYPLGTADFDSLFNKPFNKQAFKSLPQFLYMGELDDNDAAPYSDAYSEKERQLIFKLLGKKMLPDRWNRCRGIYKSNGVNAVIRTYKNTAHENPEAVKNEILKFFRKTITD